MLLCLSFRAQASKCSVIYADQTLDCDVIVSLAASCNHLDEGLVQISNEDCHKNRTEHLEDYYGNIERVYMLHHFFELPVVNAFN